MYNDIIKQELKKLIKILRQKVDADIKDDLDVANDTGVITMGTPSNENTEVNILKKQIVMTARDMKIRNFLVAVGNEMKYSPNMTNSPDINKNIQEFKNAKEYEYGFRTGELGMHIMETNWTISPSQENWVEVQNAMRIWAESVETVKHFANVLYDGVEDENWKKLLAAVMETADEAAKQKVHFVDDDGIENASAEILRLSRTQEGLAGRRRKSKKRKVKKRKSKRRRKSKKSNRRRTKRRR